MPTAPTTTTFGDEHEKDEAMKLTHVVAAALLGSTGALTASESNQASVAPALNIKATSTVFEASSPQASPGYRPSYQACLDASEGVTVNMLNCGDGELEYQDKRLNAVYKRLHQLLSPTAWESLRTEQRKWLAEEDKACEVAEDFREGTAGALIWQGCLLDRRTLRADELEALLKKLSH